MKNFGWVYTLYNVMVDAANAVSLQMSAIGQFTPHLAVTLALTNPRDVPESLRIGVNADVDLLGTADNAPMHSLGIRTGMGMANYVHNATFLLSNRPNVTPVTTYWFGQQGDRTAYQWTQVSVEAIYGPDSGLAFSWQNLVLPASGSLNLTFELHSLGVSTPPLLSITTGITSQVQLPASVQLSGIVTAFLLDTEICIVGIIDNDLISGRSISSTSISSNSSFTFEIPQGGLRVGSHS
jgi:hypothetical protein